MSETATGTLVSNTTKPPVSSSPPLDPLFSLPTPSREQVILTEKESNAVLEEFVGDGQSTGLNLKAELPTNEDILDDLPLT